MLGVCFLLVLKENPFLPFVCILCHRVQTSCRKIKMSPEWWGISLHNLPFIWSSEISKHSQSQPCDPLHTLLLVAAADYKACH